MFCYAALLWQRNAPTQRMLSQLVPNYFPSAHFHNTVQGSLYCFNNDSHAQKLFWLTSCIQHQYAFVNKDHWIFCTIINLLWKVLDALKVDFALGLFTCWFSGYIGTVRLRNILKEFFCPFGSVSNTTVLFDLMFMLCKMHLWLKHCFVTTLATRYVNWWLCLTNHRYPDIDSL